MVWLLRQGYIFAIVFLNFVFWVEFFVLKKLMGYFNYPLFSNNFASFDVKMWNHFFMKVMLHCQHLQLLTDFHENWPTTDLHPGFRPLIVIKYTTPYRITDNTISVHQIFVLKYLCNKSHTPHLR